MQHATETDHLFACHRAKDRRTTRMGNVLVAGVLVASATIAGVHGSTVQDHLARPAVSLATQVRTLDGAALGSIDAWLSDAVCGQASGNTCSNLAYPELTLDIGVALGTKILDNALQAASTPQIVFAYSEGAVVASSWLSQHAADANAPSAADLSFILIGNPKRKYGGEPGIYTNVPTTPSTQHTVLDIAHEYDSVADVPDDPTNFLAALNSIAAYAFVHTDYSTVDLVNDDKLVWVDGNTTYVLVRTKDLPLLAPLRYIGLGFIADLLDAPLKTIVDSAYSRNYPGVITDPAAAQKAVDDAMHGPTSTTADASKTATSVAAVDATATTATAAPAATRSSTTTPEPVAAAAPTAAEVHGAAISEPKSVAEEDVSATKTDDPPAAASKTADSSAARPAAATDSGSKVDVAATEPEAKADTATEAPERTSTARTVSTSTTDSSDSTEKTGRPSAPAAATSSAE